MNSYADTDLTSASPTILSPLWNRAWTTIAITSQPTECLLLSNLFIVVVRSSSREDLPPSLLFFLHVLVQHIFDEVFEVDDSFLIMGMQRPSDVGVTVETALHCIAKPNVFKLNLLEEGIHGIEVLLGAIFVSVDLVFELQRSG